MSTESIYREIATERYAFEEYHWLTERQKDLATAMGCISEENYCAAWLSGLEFELWGMAFCGADCCFGFGSVDQSWLQVLRELSDEVGGWIVWRWDEKDLDLTGCYFVPRNEWQLEYAAKVAA